MWLRLCFFKKEEKIFEKNIWEKKKKKVHEKSSYIEYSQVWHVYKYFDGRDQKQIISRNIPSDNKYDKRRQSVPSIVLPSLLLLFLCKWVGLCYEGESRERVESGERVESREYPPGI